MKPGSLVMISWFVMLVSATPCDAQAANGRDTALFVYQANSLTMKEHGDTIWMTTPARLTRIVDAAGRIQLLRQLKGQPAVVTDYQVRGDTAYPTGNGRPIAVAILRTYRFQINSARRVTALGLPHR